MKVTVFLNALGLGGTEKAACRWAMGLCERDHQVSVLALEDGPRRTILEANHIPVVLAPAHPHNIHQALALLRPQVIHSHVPGYPHPGDVLGEALRLGPKIPVVQTNIFGRLANPAEEAWTDFRLFISWTSCVQAARRAFRPLNEAFFRRASVAAYPLDPLEAAPPAEVQAFRQRLGVTADEVLFGRLSRPEPNKWTELPVEAFRLALRQNRHIKLLLREPPPAVAAALRQSPDADRFIILPATLDAAELRLTLSALDAVLHTSSIGESFGYGIAEPMNLGKPVITHSLPWGDQAQIELVCHGECGFISSIPETMAESILILAGNSELRSRFGMAAREHIRQLASPKESLDRLEQSLLWAVEGKDNPCAKEDLHKARQAAAKLDASQFGCNWQEQVALRPGYWRARWFQFKHSLRLRLTPLRSWKRKREPI